MIATLKDQDLLGLAAKATGLDIGWYGGAPFYVEDNEPTRWNPLEDDGDALRLAVLLSLRVEPYTGVKIHDRYPVANITDVYSLHSNNVKLSELHGMDPAAATRRAIFRAAAEIGKALP
ncbi:hypothetical protein K0P33_17280 [Pseudomonas sp. ArH3a]|uniref:hypothetical protein n=1 Tax=Pseudomonas sp. ArH3a TaxID=2862945 RepID=UPI001F59C805|nr:hypothetical protein [Pseudomonas sp. ArH3a]UNM17335.1 hypothetical protein K0P33_17280 [Pseudomonas sp. ArH3a]